MSKSEASEPTQEVEAQAAVAEPEPPPPPEPMTPERVLKINAYYDRYVVASVLVLVFFGAANLIVKSDIWPLLRTGALIAEKMAPITIDPYSFTMTDQRWVNIPWLFEVVNYLLYSTVAKFFTDQTRAAQVAAGAIVGLNALVRTLTAVWLLRLCRPGPGMWWVATCVGVALGGIVMMTGGVVPSIEVGGLALASTPGPETWGVLLFAMELVALDAAINRGRTRALYTLPVIFLLWANTDESFLIGLLTLVAAVLGGALGRKTGPAPAKGEAAQEGVPLGTLLAVAAGCFAVVLLNPSHVFIYPAALSPYLELFGKGPLTSDQLSFFGPASRKFWEEAGGRDAPIFLALQFAIVVMIGLGSFALNRRRFSLPRLLVFLVGVGLWTLMMRLAPFFALIFAATLATNGQEWYLDRVGADGKLGRGWAAWSVGGRSLTILALFVVLAKALTGIGKNDEREFVFGFGYEPSAFAFEAADYLKSDEKGGGKIKGRVMNLNLGQGDALIWRGFPDRQTFIDSRRSLFRSEVREDLQKVREGLAKNEPELWRPVLEKYKISAVMLPLATPADARIYESLLKSKDWVAFYDDGSAALFGWRGASEKQDVAFFEAHTLDADAMVYKRRQEMPQPERPPAGVTWIDWIVRNRSLAPLQPHVKVGRRRFPQLREGQAPTPDEIAPLFLAIREARIALAQSPDDTDALFLLDDAYEQLSLAEQAILVRQTQTPPGDYIGFRMRQRLAALNYAVQAYPPPTNPQKRQFLGGKHYKLAQLHRMNNDIDLYRDHLTMARDLIGPKDFAEAFPAEDASLPKLDAEIEKFKKSLDDETRERPLNPAEKADLCLRNGFTGMGIAYLNEFAETNQQAVRGNLVELYNRVGQPDQAYDIIASLNLNDSTLGNLPGLPAYRSGMTNYLLGYYDVAISAWRTHALPEMNRGITLQALLAGLQLSHGDGKSTESILLDLGGGPTVPSRLASQSNWESELALTMLEAGDFEGAAEHFEKALKIDPKNPIRPLIAFYLRKLGKPVPEAETPAEESPKPAAAANAPAAAPAKPGAGQPAGAPNAEPVKEEEKKGADKPGDK